MENSRLKAIFESEIREVCREARFEKRLMEYARRLHAELSRIGNQHGIILASFQNLATQVEEDHR